MSTKKIVVINGPNLNLLGEREPDIYGAKTLDAINQNLQKKAMEHGVETEFFQSNHEGDIVDKIGNTRDAQGLIINPAAFTHTSIAIKDALAAFPGKIVEVHLSNIYSREEFRKTSLTAAEADGMICGFGARSYMLALEALLID